MSNSSSVINRNPSLNETIELLSSDEEECTTKNVIDDLIDDESHSITAHTANSNTIAKANEIEDNMLTPIKNEVSYPDFYHRGINSDRDGNILESEFLNEDWMTNELVEELFYFVPPSKPDDKDENETDNNLLNKFKDFCSHLFHFFVYL
mgnify:CR=1 FL=1